MTAVDAAAPGAPTAAVLAPPADAAAGRRRLVRQAATRSLRRRQLTGRVVLALCGAAALLALVPVAAELAYTAVRGAGDLSLAFLVHPPTPPGITGGGISTAIAGTARIVGLALCMAVPVGVLVALWCHQRRGWLVDGLRFAADVMSGVPSIVIGIFAYTLVVRPLHHFSDVAAGVAVAVLMLPIMVRADEEALAAVAVDLWEAGVALGARRSKVAWSVVLRGALPGLVTGNLLAVARGVGETAPLLFTVAAPTAAMTLLIFSDGTQAFTATQQEAWATALVLLIVVLLLSVVARVAAWSLSRKAR